VKERVTEKIRKLRESKRMSQENVADELGITHSTYSKIERGETDPNVSRLYELAKVLGVDVVEFFASEKASAFKDSKSTYGNITKDDIEKLTQSMQLLFSEINKLRSDLNRKGKKDSEVKPKKKS
jgi:transcriptional regulator with XRE-family HTH domain